MHLFYILLILLLVTRLCSEVAIRLKFPPLVGELVGGILVGVVAGVAMGDGGTLANLDADRTFLAVLDLAVFFLMLLAGLEMRPKDLVGASAKAAPVAIAGMVLPLALGVALGWLWLPASDWKPAQMLFLGVALAVTAVPVAVKALLDLGQLQTPIGRVIIAAAVIDDVASLILLAILTAVLSANESVSAVLIGTIALNVSIFFAIAWASGRFLLPAMGRAVKRFNMEHAEFSLLVVYGLALAVIAELLSMHFLIGAFAAGVFFGRNVVGDDTYERLLSQTEALTLGFLAPVFFASIGMHLNVRALVEIPLFVLLLLAFATVGKLTGAGLAARAAGFATRQATAIGAAMNARGAVEIIIAGIALRAGLFDHPQPTPPVIEYLFSAIVIMAIVTTLATPFLLQRLLPKSSVEPGADQSGR